MKQRGWWLWPAALLIYTMVIFGQSMMPAVQSSAESGYVLAWLHGFLNRFGIEATWLTEHVVRKCAHFTEYAGLGVLLFLDARSCCAACSETWRGTLRWLHGAAVFLIPFVDETIQLFSPGRSGQISDVWLDMSGAAVGFLAAVSAGRIWTAIWSSDSRK